MTVAANVPDPPTEPSRSARLVHLVRRLIDYGKELAATIRQRAFTDPGSVISCFGTADIAVILARIPRGLHRADALEARLLRNADRLDAAPRGASSPPTPTAWSSSSRGPCTVAGTLGTGQPAGSDTDPMGPDASAEYGPVLRLLAGKTVHATGIAQPRYTTLTTNTTKRCPNVVASTANASCVPSHQLSTHANNGAKQLSTSPLPRPAPFRLRFITEFAQLLAYGIGLAL